MKEPIVTKFNLTCNLCVEFYPHENYNGLQ